MYKKHLRKEFLQKRLLLSKKTIEKYSIEIKSKLFKLLNFDKVKTIHIYLPFETKNEINTFYIINKIIEKYPNISIIIPKMDFKSKIIINYYYQSNLLKKNKIAILEPRDNLSEHFIFPKDKLIDIFIIPLLISDKKGNRVGYGKGYYDKLLANYPKSIKIGLSLFEPINQINDINKYDIKMDYVILPDNFYCYKTNCTNKIICKKQHNIQ